RCHGPPSARHGRATPGCWTGCWALRGARPADDALVVLLAPRRVAGHVEEHVDRFAADGGERVLLPAVGPGQRERQVLLREPVHVGALQGVRGELATEDLAVEDERVQGDAG